MSVKWSRQYDKCNNCGTIRYKHIAKGYCTRCYQLTRKLVEVDKWDYSDPQSVKGISLNSVYIFTSEEFLNFKKHIINNIKIQLKLLKSREEQLQGPIYGIDIEYMFRKIAKLCGVKENIYFGIAGYIDNKFDMEQKKILFEIFNKIQEKMPNNIMRLPLHSN